MIYLGIQLAGIITCGIAAEIYIPIFCRLRLSSTFEICFLFVFEPFNVTQYITLILQASFQIRILALALAFSRVTEKSAKLQKIFEHQIS